MKTVGRILIVLFLTTTAFAFTGFHLLGLDNNGINEIDLSLETFQQDEEIGFKQVANVIENFVVKQFQIRSNKENLEKYYAELKAKDPDFYSEVYGDLPDLSKLATRDVHRKTHGCFQADLKFSDSLADDLNQVPSAKLQALSDLGVFQPGSEYEAIVRFSNGHPQNRPDRAPDARGMAVKILKKGTLNPEFSLRQDAVALNDATLLDILTINFPTFFVNEKNTSMKYLEINEKILAGATDFTGFVKGKYQEALGLFTSGIDGVELRLAVASNGSVIKSPLYQEYFSMVASRLGPSGSGRAVKYIWTPEVCPGADQNTFERLKAKNWPEWSKTRNFSEPLKPVDKYLTPPYLPLTGYSRDYLREALFTQMKNGDFCFGLQIQPYLNQTDTNIEDSTDLWVRSEEERQWWLLNIVPNIFSPTNRALGYSYFDYTSKLAKKQISKPIHAATLRLKAIKPPHPNHPWEKVENTSVCENLSFNPWNGDNINHKPLGVISRLKRRVYNASRQMRHLLNQISH